MPLAKETTLKFFFKVLIETKNAIEYDIMAPKEDSLLTYDTKNLLLGFQ